MSVPSWNVVSKLLSSDLVRKNVQVRSDTSKKQDEKKVSQNWKQRLTFGILLFSGFSFILYQGSLALAATILLVQVMCYKEVLHIGFMINNSPKLPRFRLTAWSFFIVWNYYLMGEVFRDQFKNIFDKSVYVSVVFDHSRFKGFCMYFGCIVMFVLSLAGKYDIKRFRLLAILHVLLIVITLPSYLLIKCLFEGMIWAVVPLISVVLNDVFAYVFGKFMGKTPLIHLSPNKTREGFIGGAVGTVISTLILAAFLCNFKYFTCPTEYNESSKMIEINTACAPLYSFIPTEYTLVSGLKYESLPFMFDAFCISLFASLIAPFGGFFASGFKRAFNIKDFSNTIPGHGGILDRFDCEFLMGIFVFVYMSTFVKYSKFKKLYGKIMKLNDSDQLVFYDLLKYSLEDRNML